MAGFQPFPLTFLPRPSLSLLSPTSPLLQFPRVPAHAPPLRFNRPKSLVLTQPVPLTRRLNASPFTTTTAETTDFDAVPDESDEDAGSPWEGAVVYRRDPSATHVEYSTTLERLGLGRISSELSRSRASAMGIRIIPKRGVIDPLLAGGTPVLVSVDVTRKKRKLRLDGIVRTVMTLGCNRCAGQAAESIFSNFTLLLTEDPTEEPDKIDMGVIFGDDKSKSFTARNEETEDDDDRSIDFEDQFFFPAEVKEIDISKHIRDLIHVEITMNAVCDPNCKGLCLKCGTNLNKTTCSCESKKEEEGGEYGPLGNLKKQMEQR